MSRFRFVATLILAIVLGLLGLFLGGLIPLPEPFTESQSRAFYALMGILIGLMLFAPISAWFVRATTSLMKRMTLRVASEIIDQFNQLSPFNRPPAVDPRLEKKIVSKTPAVILDTSSIIDGRILDVAKSGFLPGTLIVPEFVLKELQQVADSADSLKRARGRRGFETVNQLKKVEDVKVVIWDEEIEGKEVDDKLVKLGKSLKGKIFTADFNLNRVAKLSGVGVLNLNELTNALKALPIPGEILEIKVIQPGKDRDQGVGYLLDGTMVVVKDGDKNIGQTVEVEVNKILQGPAGRIIFGKKV